MAATISSCKSAKKDSTAGDEAVALVGPTFNADSAYAYCEQQCLFGPRTMNSEAHDKCAQWIINKFKQFGCEVTTQNADLKGWDGTILKSQNIIARTKPEVTTRLLVCAHYDSRPWADNDPDSTNWRKPVMAANDGASGVAVMLELARLMQNDSTVNVGVDFVCFDAEDWGTPQWADVADNGDTWALGAQYFAENLPTNYDVRYGILLDMVGGQGCAFLPGGCEQAICPRDREEGVACCPSGWLREHVPKERGRHDHRRSCAFEPEGQHTHHRHHSLLSRLPAEQLRSNMAHRHRRHATYRPQHADGCGTGHGAGYF